MPTNPRFDLEGRIAIVTGGEKGIITGRDKDIGWVTGQPATSTAARPALRPRAKGRNRAAQGKTSMNQSART